MDETLAFIRDIVDRLETKIDGVVSDVQDLSLKFNDMEHSFAQHVKDEATLTKKAGAIIVATIAIIGVLGFGSVIMWAPEFIKLFNH